MKNGKNAAGIFFRALTFPAYGLFAVLLVSPVSAAGDCPNGTPADNIACNAADARRQIAVLVPGVEKCFNPAHRYEDGLDSFEETRKMFLLKSSQFSRYIEAVRRGGAAEIQILKAELRDFDKHLSDGCAFIHTVRWCLEQGFEANTGAEYPNCHPPVPGDLRSNPESKALAAFFEDFDDMLEASKQLPRSP